MISEKYQSVHSKRIWAPRTEIDFEWVWLREIVHSVKDRSPRTPFKTQLNSLQVGNKFIEKQCLIRQLNLEAKNHDSTNKPSSGHNFRSEPQLSNSRRNQEDGFGCCRFGRKHTTIKIVWDSTIFTVFSHQKFNCGSGEDGEFRSADNGP